MIFRIAMFGLIAATLFAQLYTERAYNTGSRLTCKYLPNTPCNARAVFHFVLMSTARLICLSNVASLLMVLYIHPHQQDLLDALHFLPRMMIIGVIIHIGWTFTKWGKTQNGRH